MSLRDDDDGSPTASLASLPADMLREIIRRAPIRDVLSLATVNKHCNQHIVTDHMFWSAMQERHFLEPEPPTTRRPPTSARTRRRQRRRAAVAVTDKTEPHPTEPFKRYRHAFINHNRQLSSWEEYKQNWNQFISGPGGRCFYTIFRTIWIVLLITLISVIIGHFVYGDCWTLYNPLDPHVDLHTQGLVRALLAQEIRNHTFLQKITHNSSRIIELFRHEQRKQNHSTDSHHSSSPSDEVLQCMISWHRSENTRKDRVRYHGTPADQFLANVLLETVLYISTTGGALLHDTIIDSFSQSVWMSSSLFQDHHTTFAVLFIASMGAFVILCFVGLMWFIFYRVYRYPQKALQQYWFTEDTMHS